MHPRILGRLFFPLDSSQATLTTGDLSSPLHNHLDSSLPKNQLIALLLTARSLVIRAVLRFGSPSNAALVISANAVHTSSDSEDEI
jgi:hypothetical protein